MDKSTGTSQALLRELRPIMASDAPVQERLDRIVDRVAAVLVAEVSSIYVRRKDGRLELYATKGLAPDAVHETQLKWGEGLVGRVARQAVPVNVKDAPSHPDFAFRPETREESLHAFLGVPINRQGTVLGVLTVQNHRQVSYLKDDLEALETAATLLAELLASREMQDVIDPAADIRHDLPHVITAKAISDGLALGQIVLHEPRVVITERFSDNATLQVQRLDDALAALAKQLDAMLRRGDLARTGAHRDVLEAYTMFARDAGWRRRMKEAVRTGLTAEAAVERVQNENQARLQTLTNPYLRERANDLNDLSNRLLRILTAEEDADGGPDELPDNAILVAKTLGPAELLDYDREKLKGLILEEPGHASHVSIVARTLGIAAVGGANRVLAVAEPGDLAIVDATTGETHIRPRPDVVSAFKEKISFRAEIQAHYRALRGHPAVTVDGVRVALMMNAGLLVDLPHLEESGADGIGLFRTELQFMVSSSMPRQDRQLQIYTAVLDAAGDRPVVFRTLDVGGDKVLPYMKGYAPYEENPALGWRAIRMALDRPALFRPQIRALLRAAAGRELRVMLPMVGDVGEYERACEGIAREREFLTRHGHVLPKTVKVGAMIEVPSLLWQLDLLLPQVDFVSVGTNDLLQFLFAADRSSPKLAQRFDSLNPAVLRVLREIVEKSALHGVPLTLCGEMAGDPLQAMALIGIGFRSISMAPASLGPVKEMVLSVSAARLESLMLDHIESPRGDLRRKLEEMMMTAKVDI